MAYERFEAALEACERGQDLPTSGVELFAALFEHCPPSTNPHTGRPYSYNDIGMTSAAAAVQKPEAIPSLELLERLKALPMLVPPYIPDANQRTSELHATIYVKGAILLVTWMHYEYGDDIQPTHRELSQLLSRWRVSNEVDRGMRLISSLSKRVAAELAFQRGEYARALLNMAASIDEAVEFIYEALTNEEVDGLWQDGYWAPPWTYNGRERAMEYAELLRDKKPQGTDWQWVIMASQWLTVAYPEVLLSETEGALELQVQEYWANLAGWAEAQLTPDQLRSLYEERADEAAANRLRIYFFSDGLWKHLSERAQQALVSADKQMVAGTAMSRRAGVFNELRIATEEVLHRHLWQPMSVWAEGQSPPPRSVQAVLARPGRHAPGLDDFVQLLYTDGVKEYLHKSGVDKPGMDFLTKEKRTADYLQRLQRARNPAEHEPDYAPDSAEIRALYAESLGIGRKGVLPEMLRLLAGRREGRRPDLGDLNL